MRPPIGEAEKRCFPIKTIESFISLVEEHINENSQPNLAFLSILFGYLEYELTVGRIIPSEVESAQPASDKSESSSKYENQQFPSLDLNIVQGMYEQFALMLKANVDKSKPTFTDYDGHATCALCKYVSDIIWNGLLRSYHKDKAHIQSLFSYFTGRQLDCFGLAFCVVGGCQVLGYDDVNLVISEDHAWVACGKEPKEMVEVTWHGKGNEDKRGLVVDEITTGKSWIYNDGKAMTCDRSMEFIALLLSLNPSIDMHSESSELQIIQQRLLHKAFCDGHMARFPMALGSFAELQESNPKVIPDSITPHQLHTKAVQVVQREYDDLLILPYCSKGHYHMRQGQWKRAIESWAKAAQVISKYNYGKDDEEIYKEMIDIANELIPQCLKEEDKLRDDPDCYQDVLRFYDGICLWEEGSSTPILHSWWARFFTASVGRFAPEIRESFADKQNPAAKSTQVEVVRRSSRGFASPSHRPDAEDNLGFQSPRSTTSEDSLKSPDHEPETKLGLRSHKMKALKGILTSGRKLNTQAVALLLTAQSQVHFVKRRSNVGEYGIEYTGSSAASKRPKIAETKGL